MRPEDLLARLEAGYTYDPMYGALCNERDQLKAENAKLRELCADMYRRFHGVVIENWSYSSEDFYTYEQRMCELGVEVD